MLSRDCDGCTQLSKCVKRFERTHVWDKVYCADGTAHLIDTASLVIA
jgi:hypothetical protein